MIDEPAAGRRFVAFLLGGAPTAKTGGFLYARHMIEKLRAEQRLDALIALPDRFPRGDEEALHRAASALARLPKGSLLVVDGLAFTALAPLLSRRSDLLLVALVHHPLCEETGFTEQERRDWFLRERAALALARHVIVSSETTGRRLADFGVAGEQISVVKPGIEPPRRRSPRRGRRGRPMTLLCVANLIPRKGQDLLIKALKRHQRRDWRLILAGPARDGAFARRLRRLITTLGLKGRVTVAGEVPSRRLAALYAEADLFVLPSHHEGFGIALLEAVAHGLPVLSTRAGAIPEAVPRGAGVLVPPSRLPPLADALAKLLSGDGRRLTAFRQRVGRLAPHCRSWQTAETEFAAVISRLASQR